MCQVFFECMTSTNSAYSVWYRGIKTKMTREIFQRNMLEGVSQDNSANPLYMVHVKALCEAFAKADTLEAAYRKFGIKTCWRCAGRTNEPAYLHYDALRHDELLMAPFIEAPQSKSSKIRSQHGVYPLLSRFTEEQIRNLDNRSSPP